MGPGPFGGTVTGPPGRHRPPGPPIPGGPEPWPPLSLRSLLPADTDLEDLLILAILVLLMMEEGESGTVILCAVLAYFVLGRLEEGKNPPPLPGAPS